MSENQPSLGRIEVSPTAIASIASEAMLTCYGVVGAANKNLSTGIANVISSNRKQGIEVHITEGQISIDAYVIIEYGTRIITVAHSVMNIIKFSVERALGVPISEVNVHVERLRISNVD